MSKYDWQRVYFKISIDEKLTVKKNSWFYNIAILTHTHTHTQLCIYMCKYIRRERRYRKESERERERERGVLRWIFVKEEFGIQQYLMPCFYLWKHSCMPSDKQIHLYTPKSGNSLFLKIPLIHAADLLFCLFIVLFQHFASYFNLWHFVCWLVIYFFFMEEREKSFSQNSPPSPPPLHCFSFFFFLFYY